MQHITPNPVYQRPIAWDITLPTAADKPCPLIVFLHGFNGFKDWGHWHLVTQAFVNQGFAFAKINFSHNGTNPEHLLDFVDLEAFGNNNFSKELSDVQAVLDVLFADTQLPIDHNNVTIIGHSRGGGIAILQGERDSRIHRIITWASVHELNYSWEGQPEKVAEWQQAGVVYRLNGRTQQQMPLYFQLYEDYQQNAAQFSLASALQRLHKPLLIIHGTNDTAVPLSSAQYLQQHANQAQTVVIDGADHVFGGGHPYTQPHLPSHSLELVEVCLQFLG